MSINFEEEATQAAILRPKNRRRSNKSDQFKRRTKIEEVKDKSVKV
jgi:hypothetical protein